ncbi:hypothetical protein [Salibacterium lacus]|uniref:Uncharacterized protein n=1 Tax=Salibacterium lacus TaxID=1898109 RepID=A0ABW5T369_9BACI
MKEEEVKYHYLQLKKLHVELLNRYFQQEEVIRRMSENQEKQQYRTEHLLQNMEGEVRHMRQILLEKENEPITLPDELVQLVEEGKERQVMLDVTHEKEIQQLKEEVGTLKEQMDAVTQRQDSFPASGELTFQQLKQLIEQDTSPGNVKRPSHIPTNPVSTHRMKAKTEETKSRETGHASEGVFEPGEEKKPESQPPLWYKLFSFRK